MTANLSHSDWLVLAALKVGATHGFAVSTSLAKGGDLGRIWTVRRPMVYQSLNKLTIRGLVAEVAVERSDSGPVRTLLALTKEGEAILATWLQSPVPHLRDLRPLLLVKLAVLERIGGDPAPLIQAERHRLSEVIDVRPSDADEDAVGRLIRLWRYQFAEAMVAFLDVQERG